MGFWNPLKKTVPIPSLDMEVEIGLQDNVNDLGIVRSINDTVYSLIFEHGTINHPAANHLLSGNLLLPSYDLIFGYPPIWTRHFLMTQQTNDQAKDSFNHTLLIAEFMDYAGILPRLSNHLTQSVGFTLNLSRIRSPEERYFVAAIALADTQGDLQHIQKVNGQPVHFQRALISYRRQQAAATTTNYK